MIQESPILADPAPRPALLDAAHAGSRIQVLGAEHLGLISARQLSWNEAFSRVNMFLSVLSGAVIALALIAQASSFGHMFVVAAAGILSVVLVIGVITVARLLAVNEEDVRWTAGLNRLRHAYLLIHPELEPFFITSRYDDAAGLAQSMGWRVAPQGLVGQLLHGTTSLPGMLGTVVSVLAGVVAGLIAIASGFTLTPTLTLSVGVFLVSGWALTVYARRTFGTFLAKLRPSFPGPAREEC